MMPTKVDYIIAGLGLSGAAMAWQLMKRGRSIVLFDTAHANRSSHQAAGLFNPVTGQGLAKAWMADLLFPALHRFYPEVEQSASEKFFHRSKIYIPFRSIGEQNDWAGNSEMAGHVGTIYTAPAYGDQVHDDMGGLLLSSGGYLHVRQYLIAMRRLIEKVNPVRQQLNIKNLRISADHVEYEDLRAHRIIFCDGLSARQNPLTSWLPVKPLKGESIDIRTDFPLHTVYNRGIYIVPWDDGKYRAGATYERTDSPGITIEAKRDLESRLGSLLRVPFTVTGQDWGIRPTVPDRRPVLGSLQDHPRIVVFNGMGTKGVSLAPYFSEVLANYLEDGDQIPREVNISRFYTLSSRSAD